MRANAFSSVAAIIAPLAVGASLAIGAGWITGYVVPIAIGAVLVCALAMRAGGPERSFETMDPAPLPPFRHWWRACAVLGVAVVVEFCFTYFAVTYLHDERGLSKAAAAAGGAAWGIGMAIGRFAFSVRQPPPSIVPSAAVILAGFVLFWGVPNSAVAIIGITIAGLGVAPLYPSRIIILMERFPGATHEGSKRAALASGWALLVAPALMVSLRAASNVRVAYLVVPVLLVLLVALASPRSEHSRHLVAA
jgi:fucose permease